MNARNGESAHLKHTTPSATSQLHATYVLCFEKMPPHHVRKYSGRSLEPVDIACTNTHPMLTEPEKSRAHWM